MRIYTPPEPESRLSHELYLQTRSWLLEHDEDAAEMLRWTNEDRKPAETPERLAGEIIWIILCAGRSAQAARTIEKKVLAKIHDGRPAVEAFGYKAKAAAIDRAWSERADDFEEYQRVMREGRPEDVVAWCKSIPFVGDDTQYQLAKNLGADCAKPDIWLCRLTGIPDSPRLNIRQRFAACMAYCRWLSQACGDSIAAVDSLCWLACNKKILHVGPDAGPVRFVPSSHRGRSMLEAADSY